MSRITRGLRIKTKCVTIDQLVAWFHRFCDETSIFIATTEPRAEGIDTLFSIDLASGEGALVGEGVVLAAWATRDNRFNAPGMQIGVRKLTRQSVRVFEQMLIARAVANEVPSQESWDDGTDVGAPSFDELQRLGRVAEPAPAVTAPDVAASAPATSAPAASASAPVAAVSVPSLSVPVAPASALAASPAGLAVNAPAIANRTLIGLPIIPDRKPPAAAPAKSAPAAPQLARASQPKLGPTAFSIPARIEPTGAMKRVEKPARAAAAGPTTIAAGTTKTVRAPSPSPSAIVSIPARGSSPATASTSARASSPAASSTSSPPSVVTAPAAIMPAASASSAAPTIATSKPASSTAASAHATSTPASSSASGAIAMSAQVSPAATLTTSTPASAPSPASSATSSAPTVVSSAPSIAPEAVPQAVPVLPLAPTTLPRAKTPVQPTPVVPAIPLDERSIVDAKPIDDSPSSTSAVPATSSPERVTDEPSSPRVPRAATVLGSGPVERLPARIVADVAYDADVDAEDEDSIDTGVGAELARDAASIPEPVLPEATVPEGAPEAALAALAAATAADDGIPDAAEAPFERELRMSRERAAVIALERALTGGDADPAAAYPRAAPTDLPQQTDRSTDPLLAWSKTAEVQPLKRRRLRMALAAIVVAAGSVFAGFGVQSWLQAQDAATRTSTATTVAEPAPALPSSASVPAEPAPMPVVAAEPAPGAAAAVEPAAVVEPAAPAAAVDSAPPVASVAADHAPALVPVAADPAPASAPDSATETPVAPDPAAAAAPAPVVARSAVAKRSVGNKAAQKPVKRAVKRPTRKKACVDLSCL